MRRKRQGNLVTAGLALCVAILALLAAFMNFDEVSTARGAPAEETPVIGLWGAGILADIVPPGEQTPVLSVEVMPQPTPELVQRYSSVTMTADERLELAEVIRLPAVLPPFQHSCPRIDRGDGHFHGGLCPQQLMDAPAVFQRPALFFQKTSVPTSYRVRISGMNCFPMVVFSASHADFIVFRFRCRFHLGRVQDVAEDSRLRPEQLEVGVHELAEGVLLPVVREAQLLHRLVPAGSQNGGIGLGGLLRRLHRRRPHNKGDAHLGHVGRTDRRGRNCPRTTSGAYENPPMRPAAQPARTNRRNCIL